MDTLLSSFIQKLPFLNLLGADIAQVISAQKNVKFRVGKPLREVVEGKA